MPRLLPYFSSAQDPKLTIAHDLLNRDERDGLGKAWRGLGACSTRATPSTRLPKEGAPTWVTLDLADPNTLPHLTWPVILPNAANGTPKLENLVLDPKEISLILSDRHPNDQKPPTTVAQVSLQRIVARPNANGWQIETATETQPQGAKSHLRNTAQRRMARHSILPVVGQKALVFAFDPVEVPRWIRGQQDLPTPVFRDPPDDAPSGVLTPVRHGAHPLGLRALGRWLGAGADPQPYRTDLPRRRPYTRSEDPRSPQNKSGHEGNPRRFRGAVAFGNRGDLPARPGEPKHGEQPWSITSITDVAHTAGVWTYDPAGKRIAVEFAIADPEVILDGFFWLAAGQPSAERAACLT